MNTLVCDACQSRSELPYELGGEIGRCPTCHRFNKLQGTKSVEGGDRLIDFVEVAVAIGQPPEVREAFRYKYVPWALGIGAEMAVLYLALMPVLASFGLTANDRMSSWGEWALKLIGRPDGLGQWEAIGFAVVIGLAYWLNRTYLCANLYELYVRWTGAPVSQVGFAKAGGMDIVKLAPSLGILAVLGVYVATIGDPDPIRAIRSPWIFAFLASVPASPLGIAAARWCFARRFGDGTTPATPSAGVAGVQPKGPTGTAAAFSPDGRRLAIGDSDGTVRLWDQTAGGPPRAGGAQVAGITCVRFAADGTQLVSGAEDRTVVVWDAGWLRPSREIDVGGPVKDIRFVRGVARLAVLAGVGPVQFLDTSGRPLAGATRPGDACIAADRLGTCLVAGGLDLTIRAYSPETLTVVAERRFDRRPTALACGRGPHEIAVADGRDIQVWDLIAQAGRAILQPGCERARILEMDGDWLAAADDAHVHVWNWHDGRLLARLPAADKVLALAVDRAAGQVRVAEAGDADRPPAVRTLAIPAGGA